jgi:hypothetical protein
MKQIYKNLIAFFSVLMFGSYASADLLTDCMQAISNNTAFQSAMTSEIFKTQSDFTQEFVTQNKSKIFGAIGSTMLLEPQCSDNISTLARRANGKVWLKQPDKTYAFQFQMTDLFQYLTIPTGIMLYNNKTLKTGDVIKLSDISKLYWSDECSDHNIWDNLDDDASINIAGQKVFSQYGGSKNEFFLDFEEGNNRRAFPGLVLMDKTNSTSEAIVAFNNLHTSIKATEDFANALTGTACARDGLVAYTVSLDVKPYAASGEKRVWGYSAGIAGATPLVVGIGLSKGAAALGLTKVGSVLATTAGPVGWIIGGILAATATTIALIPEKIQDIQQVMVLDGPHILK